MGLQRAAPERTPSGPFPGSHALAGALRQEQRGSGAGVSTGVAGCAGSGVASAVGVRGLGAVAAQGVLEPAHMSAYGAFRVDSVGSGRGLTAGSQWSPGVDWEVDHCGQSAVSLDSECGLTVDGA